jgi:hypothetical protein
MNVDPAKDVRSAGPRTGPRAQVTGPEKFGVSREELPAGGMMIMQSQNATLCVTKEETTVQLHGTGPWGVTYVSPMDDPRLKARLTSLPVGGRDVALLVALAVSSLDRHAPQSAGRARAPRPQTGARAYVLSTLLRV